MERDSNARYYLLKSEGSRLKAMAPPSAMLNGDPLILSLVLNEKLQSWCPTNDSTSQNTDR